MNGRINIFLMFDIYMIVELVMARIGLIKVTGLSLVENVEIIFFPQECIMSNFLTY